jgi:hypothetical protein
MRNALPLDCSPREKMRFHAIGRLWQRRGVILSDAQYEAIVHGIRVGCYKQIAVGDKQRQIFEITHRGNTVYAVFDPQFDCVVTFLPHRTWAERHADGRPRRQTPRQRADALFAGAQL